MIYERPSTFIWYYTNPCTCSLWYIVHVVAFIITACQTTLNLLFRCLLVFACIWVERGALISELSRGNCAQNVRVVIAHTTESQCITIEMRTRMQSESTTDMEYWLKLPPGFVQKKSTMQFAFWNNFQVLENQHISMDERNIMNGGCSFCVSKFSSPKKQKKHRRATSQNKPYSEASIINKRSRTQRTHTLKARTARTITRLLVEPAGERASGRQWRQRPTNTNQRNSNVVKNATQH